MKKTLFILSISAMILFAGCVRTPNTPSTQGMNISLPPTHVVEQENPPVVAQENPSLEPVVKPEDSQHEQNRTNLSVRLIDRGSAPYHVLRYRLDDIKEEYLQTETTQSTKLQLAGRDMPAVNVPPVKMTIHTQPQGLDNDGKLRVSTEITSISVSQSASIPESMRQHINSELEQIRGLSTWTLVDSSGGILDNGMNIPSTVRDQALVGLLQEMRSNTSFSSIRSSLRL